MIANLKDILPKARKGGYAAPAFNVYNIESAQAAIAAAVELKSPVILQTSEKALDYAGVLPLYSALMGLVKAVQIPVVLHLDHGRSVEVAKKCIDAGWSSVMIDVSTKPFKENVFETRQVVEYAKRKGGVSVEGELGPIPGQEDYISRVASYLTDPEHARIFVEQTGIDAFAGSVGLAHGVKIKKEKLNLELLAKIAALVAVPLVLHGASEGVTDKEIKKAISLGVAKINIDTHLRLAWNTAVRKFLDKNQQVYDPREILSVGRGAMKKCAIEKIKLFGSSNKA